MKYIFILFITQLLSSLTLAGEITPPLTELEPMQVTVTRTTEIEQKIIRPLVLIKQSQIEQIQPVSTAELMNHEVNMNAVGGPRADNQSINIRGLQGNQVLQLVDGVRQNFESGHRPTFFLDPLLLKNVEVLKGPSSSLWGSGALGGVVSQNTISASDLLKPNQEMGGLVKQSYNDNGNGNATLLSAGLRTSQTDVVASAYYHHNNDVTLGDGSTLKDSAQQDYGAHVKGEWQVDDAQNIIANFRQSQSDGHIPSNGAAAPSTSNFLISRHVKHSSSSLNYQLDNDSPWVNLQTLLYYNTTTADESRLTDGRKDSTQLDTIGFNFNNRSTLNINQLLYGIDYYQDDFSANRGGTNRPTPPKAVSSVIGTFIKLITQITDSVKSAVGARYDHFETDAKNIGSSNSDHSLSPSAEISWEATKWLVLAMRYDEAFRAPSSEELYTTGTHFCMFPGFCNTFISNPNLDPEKAQNKEILAKINLNKVFNANDSLWISTSIFQNDVNNFIEQVVTDPTFFPVMNPGTTTWRNVDEAQLRGFEIQTKYQWNNLLTRIGYGEMEGTNKKDNDYLYNIPANKWTSDISYYFIPNQLNIGFRFTRAERQSDVPDASTIKNYGSYNVTDLYVHWQPAVFKDALSLDLSINNLTDKYYRIAFENLYATGREVRLSASYHF